MIRYEANPPKILPDSDTAKDMTRFVEKIKTISTNVMQYTSLKTYWA